MDIQISNVARSGKILLIATFSILRNTNLKYLMYCASLVG